MQFEKYEIKASSSLLRFEFYSTGPKGKIKKQVEFEAFEETPNVFNIGFGDVDDKGNINDLIITGNDDSQKVLATAALSVFKFFEKYPNCYVYATGSSKRRTRLYRMGIANNLAEIIQTFKVYGFGNDTWENFEKGKEYEAFLIHLKSKKK
jgi:hypothetical protein